MCSVHRNVSCSSRETICAFCIKKTFHIRCVNHSVFVAHKTFHVRCSIHVVRALYTDTSPLRCAKHLQFAAWKYIMFVAQNMHLLHGNNSCSSHEAFCVCCEETCHARCAKHFAFASLRQIRRPTPSTYHAPYLHRRKEKSTHVVRHIWYSLGTYLSRRLDNLWSHGFWHTKPIFSVS